MTAGAPTEPSLVDVVLGQGDAAAVAAARARWLADPEGLIAYAEEVAFVQSVRLLACEPGPLYGGKLADVLRQAQVRQPAPAATSRPWLWAVVAAAVAFVALSTWDPLRSRRDAVAPTVAALSLRTPVADPDALAVAVDGSSALPGAVDEDDVGVIRRRLELEASTRLRESFDEGLRRSGDSLRAWLDPRNAMMLARFDLELRAHAESRRAALAHSGGLPAADERVQGMADEIAAAVLAPFDAPAEAATVGCMARALVAAGAASPARRLALARCGRLLADGLATAHGEVFVAGLAGLLDVALATGEFAAEARRHGDRLLAELLAVDEETWLRRLPALLSAAAPPAAMGEAAKALSRLPAFGAEPNRCAMARGLLVGALRERLARGDDDPGVVAALLYGGGDLLPADERAARERSLRRWKPIRLVPDFVLCHQFASSLAPDRAGFARHQAELRELAIVAAPAGWRDRGAFCLCLADLCARQGAPGPAAAGRSGS